MGNNPSTINADFADMQSAWTKIDDIIKGAEAVRAGGETYLPKLPRESRKDYDARRAAAPFVNLFRDISDNLGARPFAKKAHLVEGTASKEIVELAEDVDGEGSNLHIFAQNMFRTGINYGVAFVFVNFTPIPTWANTIALQKPFKPRPFLHEIHPTNMLSARTAQIGGVEQFIHVRWLRTIVEDDGYDEVTREQVVEYGRTKLKDGTWGKPYWMVHQKKEGGHDSKDWEIVEAGQLSIDVIPLVAYVPGRRKGRSWRVTLPMGDCADLQIEHYQAESGLKQLKTLCQYPMISAEGVEPPEGGPDGPPTIDVGPMAIMFAPNIDGKPGSYKILEPSGSSIKVLSDDIDRMEKQIREIGRQPLTANSGNLTVVTTQFAASKGNSAIEAWALILKDSLEQVFKLMALWNGDVTSKPEVQLHVDLSVDMTGDDFKAILDMRRLGDVSQETLWNEAKRRGILSADHSSDDEKERLTIENPDPDTEDEVEAALTPGVIPFKKAN